MSDTHGLGGALDALRASPAWASFGFRERSRSADAVELELEHAERWVQPEGVLHGGTLSALMDTAAVALLYADLPRELGLTSIEFKLNFIGPARAEGGPVVARSERVRAGRRVQLAQVSVHQDERELARGLFTYLVLERDKA